MLVYILEENGHLLRRPTTNDLTTKIEELEAELERERSEAKALENQLQKKNKASESEIRHLEAKVRDLEQSLYPAGTCSTLFCCLYYSFIHSENYSPFKVTTQKRSKLHCYKS